jgi:hypothetical protein
LEILKAGGMAQVVEHLPSKHKTLSSNPITPQKKKKEKENIESQKCIQHT